MHVGVVSSVGSITSPTLRLEQVFVETNGPLEKDRLMSESNRSISVRGGEK